PLNSIGAVTSRRLQRAWWRLLRVEPDALLPSTLIHGSLVANVIDLWQRDDEGFAMRLPDSQIFAADADPKALRATLRNAKLNNVQSRVYGVGIVKPRQFDTYLKPEASLLVMDCEGAEFTLLNPDNDPILLRTHILVEVHPEFGSELDIIARFTQTHRPKTINQISRSEPATRPIPRIDFVRAADERRGRDRWVFLECIDQD